MAATTQYGGGIHEPVKHERAFLLEFLEAVAEDNAEAASEVPEQQVYAAASFRSAEAPTHFGATCQADLPAWIPAMRTLELPPRGRQAQAIQFRAWAIGANAGTNTGACTNAGTNAIANGPSLELNAIANAPSLESRWSTCAHA